MIYLYKYIYTQYVCTILDKWYPGEPEADVSGGKDL